MKTCKKPMGIGQKMTPRRKIWTMRFMCPPVSVHKSRDIIYKRVYYTYMYTHLLYIYIYMCVCAMCVIYVFVLFFWKLYAGKNPPCSLDCERFLLHSPQSRPFWRPYIRHFNVIMNKIVYIYMYVQAWTKKQFTIKIKIIFYDVQKIYHLFSHT